MWIFGYGSLIWKIDFPFKIKLVGYIRNYIRRFWQGSEDHRGVPGKDIVWGVAYEIAEEEEKWVKEHLDFREKGGYIVEPTLFTPVSEWHAPFNVDVYVGPTDNPFFLGPAEEDEMALQISASRGKSGSNADYLFELARAMKDIAPHVTDQHLFSLERKVKAILTSADDDNKEDDGGGKKNCGDDNDAVTTTSCSVGWRE